MTRSMNFYAILGARLLMGGFFIWSAIINVTNFDFATATFAAAHIPLSAFMVSVAILVEAIGGTMIVLGRHMRTAAAVLAAYLTVVTVLLHANFGSLAETQIFLENLALIGGLLYMTVLSPQK